MGSTQNVRHIGIDLLKAVSMFLVVVLHIMGQGGAAEAATGMPLRDAGARLLVCLSSCSVDCFALATGYLCIASRNHPSRLVQLWLQVMLYSSTITLLFAVLLPGSVSLSGVISAFMPITYQSYWYITAYMGMFLLVPVLNAAVVSLNQQNLLRTLTIAVAVFSITTCLPMASPFGLAYGYSTLWLCVMYLFGAYFRRYECFKGISKASALICYTGCCVAMALMGAAAEYITQILIGKPFVWESLTCHASPLVVASAFALFACFVNIETRTQACSTDSHSSHTKKHMGRERIAQELATTSLGVYLIHAHPLVFELVFKDTFAFLPALPFPFALPVTLGCAVSIYVICSALDLLRIALFKQIGISHICEQLCTTCERILDQTLRLIDIVNHSTPTNQPNADIDALVRHEYDRERFWAQRILAEAPFSQNRDALITQAYAEIGPLVRSIAQAEGRSTANAYGAQDLYPRLCILLVERLLHERHDTPIVFYEAGVGTGAVVLALANDSRVHVQGCDVCIDSILREQLPQIDETSLFKSLSDLPDSSIDIFYWNDVMEHLCPDELEAHLTQIVRCLRPGGLILTITPNRLSGPHDITQRADPNERIAQGLHLREYTLAEVTHMFTAHGLRPAGIPLPRGLSSRPLVLWQFPQLMHGFFLFGETITHAPGIRKIISRKAFAPAWSLFRKPKHHVKQGWRTHD